MELDTLDTYARKELFQASLYVNFCNIKIIINI